MARQTRTLPLYVKVIGGVLIGGVLGWAFGTEPYLFGLRNEYLGQAGLLVVRLLKALATPLILFAILDGFISTDLSLRHGMRLLGICLINVTVAMTIGLTIMNLVQPGLAWAGDLAALTREIHERSPAPLLQAPKSPDVTLNVLTNLGGYVPENLVEPFLKNNIISIVLFAVLCGCALRRVRTLQNRMGDTRGIETIERVVRTGYQVFVQMLEWIVQAVPFAVLGVVAQVVGKAGLGVFSILWVLLLTILAGLAIHALVYYPALAWWAGRKPPSVYLGKGADAILTALSTNSSLATVPVTLRCLTGPIGVSDRSARLACCVGTNLNNDGITLYEAMTVLFLAQAAGYSLDYMQQAVVVLSAILAGAGIAGIPEAGLIVLPLVLSAVGLPDALIAAAIPLILPVDWIIARCRSAVNVMSDMLVAIMLDRRER
ncbi:MAG: dicarboxylate/amino acid:cation symporter [Methylotetracoccus sp.]